MSAIPQLMTDHIDIWTAADTGKKSGRGHSSGNTGVYGIKKLRDLILELAVRGKLVQQDSNDEPASALLKRIQAEKAKLIADGKIKKDKPLPPITDDEKPYALPNGWEWQRLSNLCILENGDRGKNYPNKSVLVEAGIPFVNAGHLQNGQIDKNQMTFITKERFDILRGGKFQENDILFCLRGSLGKSALVKGFEEGAIASSLVIIRLFPHLDATYFVNYFDCPLSSKMVKKYDNGTAQPNLSSTDLAKFLVPLPPLAEQHRIVAKVDELMALCDQLETQHSNVFDAHENLVGHLLDTLTQSQSAEDFSANWQRIAAHFDTLFTTEASIDALKQTLLQLAVMGKLVPQDANDEPASALLNRYKISSTASFVAGWSEASLGELGDIYGGATPSKVKPEYWVGNIPWISPKDMKRFYIDDAEDKVSESAVRETALKLIPAGSLLMVVRGMILAHSFPVALTTREATINQDMKALVVPGEIKNYLLLYMRAMKNSFVALVDRSSHGTCKLISEKLWTSMVEIPPKAEQDRIVAKVDELIALCDQIKARITAANLSQQKLADVIAEQALA